MKKKIIKPKKKILENHKSLLKGITSNLGKPRKRISLKQSMIDQGYSESYAHSGEIKKSKSWNQLMEEYLPDDLLAEKHYELLNAHQVEKFTFPRKARDEDILNMVENAGFKVINIAETPFGKIAFYSIANSKAKKDALDMAFKLKNKYAPEEIHMKYSGYTKEQLVDMLINKIHKK